ncbi:hypothetical protein [Streptomyces sp. NPDC048577]|uniref:hypothetical protein n=1 Tax=Streptomyces sp. NPDC048577 TaxID=3157209 RepID=UPI0034411931
MISYTDSNSSIRFVGMDKMTGRSVVSTCSLGLSGSAFAGNGLFGAGTPGTSMPGFASLRPAAVLTGLPVMERDERPTEALEAGVAACKASAHAIAATGAETEQQTTKHYTMWAIRGLEPWSDPV